MSKVDNAKLLLMNLSELLIEAGLENSEEKRALDILTDTLKVMN